jgi:hypothetical protein
VRKQEMRGAGLFITYQLMCMADRSQASPRRRSISPLTRSEKRRTVEAYEATTVRFNEPHTALHFPQHLLALPVLGRRAPTAPLPFRTAQKHVGPLS